jgi:hypothetical protein
MINALDVECFFGEDAGLKFDSDFGEVVRSLVSLFSLLTYLSSLDLGSNMWY